MSDYKVFLVPFDFSVHARAALSAAADLGGRLGADLHLVHVLSRPSFAYVFGGAAPTSLPPPIDMTAVRERALESLREVAAEVADFPGDIEAHVVEGTAIAGAIRDSAEELGADLIVMGTHGRTGLGHAFIGSVAERTLRRAPCPVLTIQSSETEEGS